MSEYETPNFSLDLSDQVALVTGASSGLGYRFAKVLAKCGAKVAISARRKEKLEALAKEIESDGGECLVVPLDMTNRKSINSAVESISSDLGTINTLINNAGIPDAQWAVKQSEELIDNVMETNLTGPYILYCEVARKLMSEEKPGRMVNIASIAAFNTTPQSAAALYSITKKAIVRMTEALAVEWSKNHINVNAIAPGRILTQFHKDWVDNRKKLGDTTTDLFSKESLSSVMPLGRAQSPEDIGALAAFLASEDAKNITGQTIQCDGGQVMS